MISFSIHKQLHTAAGIMPLDISCTIQQGELLTIYGASGAGKTTALRILAGLLQPEAGRITVDDEVWLDTQKRINIAPQKRHAGLLFQDYALFPSMTVEENIAYGLGKGQDKKMVHELMDLMELGQLGKRYPETLSGGQKQRVALARALARKPKLLLLDEPLSALDNTMRIKLQEYILQVHRHFGLSTILVSHDIAEVFKLSNKIIVLEQGMVIKQGTPSEVFLNRQSNGELQLTGQVTAIDKEGVAYTVSVLINNEVIKVEATVADAACLSPGDKVVVSSKLHGPTIRKITIQ